MKPPQEKFRRDFLDKASWGKLDLEEYVSENDCKALERIAKDASCDCMKIVEVGSWKGKSTSVLGKVAKSCNGRVCAVDHWKGTEGVWNYDIAGEYDVLAIFRNNMRLLKLENVVYPMVMSSEEAILRFSDETLDLVFLDADHRYEHTKQDIKRWLPKIKHGGVMCGHDCEKYYVECSEELKRQIDEHLNDDVIHGVCHPGVVKAVYEHFGNTYHIMKDSRVWYYTKERNENTASI